MLAEFRRSKDLIVVEQYLQLLRTGAALSLWAVCFFLLLQLQLALMKYLFGRPSDPLLALIGISVFVGELGVRLA